MKTLLALAVSLLLGVPTVQAVGLSTSGTKQFDCPFGTVNVSLSSDGSVRYTIIGTCSVKAGDKAWGEPYIAKGVWNPKTHVASEDLKAGVWSVRDETKCLDDPWLHVRQCAVVSVVKPQEDPNGILNGYGYPLSPNFMSASQVATLAELRASAKVESNTPPPPPPPTYSVLQFKSPQSGDKPFGSVRVSLAGGTAGKPVYDLSFEHFNDSTGKWIGQSVAGTFGPQVDQQKSALGRVFTLKELGSAGRWRVRGRVGLQAPWSEPVEFVIGAAAPTLTSPALNYSATDNLHIDITPASSSQMLPGSKYEYQIEKTSNGTSWSQSAIGGTLTPMFDKAVFPQGVTLPIKQLGVGKARVRVRQVGIYNEWSPWRDVYLGVTSPFPPGPK